MLDAVNPATGQLIRRYPKMRGKNVSDVVDRVADAWPEWDEALETPDCKRIVIGVPAGKLEGIGTREPVGEMPFF